MKKPILLSFLLATLIPTATFALSDPQVATIPSTVDADFYTLEITIPIGAKVTVVGGPSFVPPVTDGVGNDELDGYVEVLVGLAQDQANVFSIAAEREGDFSDSIEITINEQEDPGAQQQGGDTTPPAAPVIDPVENPVAATSYKLTGSAEASANIYVKNTDGSSAASTQANSNGYFEVTVDLVTGKTNRFNVSAEDPAYNVGPSTQVIIQAVAPEGAEEEPIEEEEQEPVEESQPEVAEVPFSDIVDHWAESYIGRIYKKGIVSGKSATRFDPNAEITRAELTKIALIAFGHTVPESGTGSAFEDVTASAWFARFVEKAYSLGIVSGYDDGFRPNQPISRAAALKILLEASGLDIGDEAAQFEDVPSSAWFRKYVAFAQGEDIVGGYEDGTFQPNNRITRAEVAKIVTKILDLRDEL